MITEQKQKADELKKDYKAWACYSETTQWDKWLKDGSNITAIKAIDIIIEQTDEGKFKLTLINTLNYEMHFTGNFKSNKVQTTPTVVDVIIPPGKGKIVEVKTETHDINKKDIELEWTNTFTNEYRINNGQIFTESGIEKIVLK